MLEGSVEEFNNPGHPQTPRLGLRDYLPHTFYHAEEDPGLRLVTQHLHAKFEHLFSNFI